MYKSFIAERSTFGWAKEFSNQVSCSEVEVAGFSVPIAARRIRQALS